jgi:hypothetical protein
MSLCLVTGQKGDLLKRADVRSRSTDMYLRD